MSAEMPAEIEIEGSLTGDSEDLPPETMDAAIIVMTICSANEAAMTQRLRSPSWR